MMARQAVAHIEAMVALGSTPMVGAMQMVGHAAAVEPLMAETMAAQKVADKVVMMGAAAATMVVAPKLVAVMISATMALLAWTQAMACVARKMAEKGFG